MDTWVGHARGTPGIRLTDDELREKFHGLADGVLGRDRAQRMADATFALRDGGDVEAMLALTTP